MEAKPGSLSEPAESVPLLPSSPHTSNEPPQKAVNRYATVRVDTGTENLSEDEDDTEDKVLFADHKKRGTSLILSDSFLLVLSYLQIFSVIQSLALRWPWPQGWLYSTRFVFLFNLDVWEFLKLEVNGTYKNVQSYYTPSATMPIPYWVMLVAWGGILLLALVAFIIAYIAVSFKRNPYMFVRIAQMKRVYIIFIQIITIPLGMVLARLFHCNGLGQMDVSNDILCFQGVHWAYLGPAICLIVIFYIIFPIWLITKTRSEVLGMTTDRHEGYLQLKETEYVQGLDMLWLINGFHIFSSFKKYGTHFRASMHYVMFALIVFYAAMHNFIYYQSLVFNLSLFVIMAALLLLRPYRVSCFNYMLFFNYLCLVLNCLMGTLMTSFTANSVQSVWLTPTYMTAVLIAINTTWLVVCILFLLYLLLRHLGCCSNYIKEPLWPSMTSQGLDKLTPETRKYIRAVLQGKVLVEKSLSMAPLFAPAHELSRQIQIVNAYCREAEYLRDPIHDTLWDTLDELVEAHSQIAPRSLFADSVKESIRHTATEFMKIMPAFKRRLAQREYDLILINPMKRRMLLKMYCMGLFLNGRRNKVVRERFNEPAMHKIWQDKHLSLKAQDSSGDDGYYEDMYPEPEPGLALRPSTVFSLELTNTEADLDDEVAIEEAEEWAKEHPLSRRGYTNRGFERDDLTSIMQDSVSMDLTQMLEGIPSLPATARTAHTSRPWSMQGRPSSNASGHLEPLSEVTPIQAEGTAMPTVDSQPASPRPGSAQERPGSGQNRPNSAQERPSSGQNRPSSAQERPGSGQNRPSSAQERPGSANSRPGSAQGRPDNVHSRPGSAQVRPGSAQAKPGSVPSSRPGSAASLLEEPRQSTPLPGQVDDGQEPDIPVPSGGTSVPKPGESIA